MTMPRKISIQVQKNGRWETFCIWLESDRVMAEPLLKTLKSRYEDARIIDDKEVNL